MRIIFGALAAATAMLSAGALQAQANETSAPSCTLIFGGDQGTPGEMFQYLQDRERGASGTPKEVADAYPDEFENVGDLVRQKCFNDRRVRNER